MSDIKVAVLAGGFSCEKEISTQSAENILEGLLESGFESVILDPADEDFDIEYLRKFDIIYPMLHGVQGEDGMIQGILEYLNIPYVGCDILASAITMNKRITKDLFKHLNIPSPEGFVLSNNIEENLKKIKELGYPVFIKPISEGSSLGTLVLHNEIESINTLECHLKKFPYSLVEKFIEGREMTAGIIEYESQVTILPILELKPKGEYYSFETKYTKGMTEFVIPTTIEEKILKQIHVDLRKIFDYFELKHCVRIDFILTEEGPLYLEINSIPGMTDSSDIPVMLKSANISTADFVKSIIKDTLEKFSCK